MRQQRKAFTLIEMMVSVALVLLIMVILSGAFATALESFRLLKGIGDMEQRLRTVTLIMRNDLASYEIEGPGGVGNKLSLKDNTFLIGPPGAASFGFFRIFQGSATTTEGFDGDGIPSLYATNHVLHFTVLRKANPNGYQRTDNFFADIHWDPSAFLGWASNIPGSTPDGRYQDPNTYSSHWAEIAYYLRPNGASANGTPLFTLYRRQLLVTPDTSLINAPAGTFTVSAGNLIGTTAPAYAEISCKPDAVTAGFIHFNSPADLTVPQLRFGMYPATPIAPPAGVTCTLDWPPIDPAGTGNGTGGIPQLADGTQFVSATKAVDYYSYLADQSEVAAGTNTYLYTPLAGSDALLTDVISFVVQIGTASGFSDLLASSTNPLFGLSTTTNPNQWRVYDTWTTAGTTSGGVTYPPIQGYSYGTGDPNAALPLSIAVPAIRVIIRVWDQRTQQARQVTIIQNM